MRGKTLTNWLCLSGIVSLFFYILHTVIGAMNYPGYDWRSQAVSDLTATNAPSFVIANGLVSIHHLFASLSSVLVCIIIQGKGNEVLRIGIYLFAIMNWASAIGYTLFPFTDSGYAGTFQDVMHVYVVTVIVVILSIVSISLIIIGGFENHKKYKSLAIWATVTLVFMIIGPIGTSIVPKTYFGIAERFSVYSVAVFNAILGLYGFVFIERIEKNFKYRKEA
ncbi:DUF998 domain-containing protein [Alkalibacterium sp. 20]|uniref:DUF998 domain-containing protein n=1 Tax=Alkalibacterium sp. 20 TaxID=1798803 RepID=UPI0009003E07|nr:DUF998 domain-containing protein [Alkalibacterium sp. 20]